MAVTRGVNTANRDKIAFQLCKQKCLSDALELTGAWISQRSLCWKKILGWKSTVQPPPAQSTSIFKVRCSTHVDNWIQATWMLLKKYRWPIICNWLAHSRSLYLPIEHCPFYPCLQHPAVPQSGFMPFSLRKFGSCLIFFQCCLCVSFGVSVLSSKCLLPLQVTRGPQIQFCVCSIGLPVNAPSSFVKALSLSSLAKVFTD